MGVRALTSASKALTLAAAGRGRRQQEGVDVGSRKQMRRRQQEAGVDVVGSTWRGVDVGSRKQMRRRQQEAGVDVIGSRKQMWIVLNVVVRTWRGVDVGSKKALTEGGSPKKKISSGKTYRRGGRKIDLVEAERQGDLVARCHRAAGRRVAGGRAAGRRRKTSQGDLVARRRRAARR